MHLLIETLQIGESINYIKEINKYNSSLYSIKKDDHIAKAAPYLFSYIQKTEFSNWINSNAWGNNCIVIVNSEATFNEMHKHFRRFLVVLDEEAKQMYFRFYDPSVLRIFLPTCDAQQLKEFFGPIQKFICEDEDPEFALLLSFNGEQLITERVEAHKIFITQNESLINDHNIAKAVQVSKPKRKFFFD